MKRFRLGAVTDYDVIVIGGQKFSANQILDKQLIAKTATPLYHGDFKTPFKIIPAGQPIGRVFSYIKATRSTGKNALMVYDNPQYTGNPYFVLDESGIDTSFLKDQGTQDISAEIKAEQDKLLQQNSPIEYYFKKYAFKTMLIGGGIYAAVKLGSTFIQSEVTKKPALSGLPMKKPLLIAGGIVAVSAIAYFSMRKPKVLMLTPYEKILKDVLDPNTQFGKEQRGYLVGTGNDPENYDNLKSGADYRVAVPSDHIAQVYWSKPTWAADEVVTY